jgi:hypothetical protein
MSARQAYHRIRVSAVVVETADAHTLVLEVPPGSAAAFAYRPGQFLTVRVPGRDGAPIARCYSLSSAPGLDAQPAITVKRVAGGHVSNWICDHVVPGTVLETLPPAGTFTPDSADADLLALAAGSGITPVFSILKAALTEGSGRVALVYANRDPDSTRSRACRPRPASLRSRGRTPTARFSSAVPSRSWTCPTGSLRDGASPAAGSTQSVSSNVVSPRPPRPSPNGSPSPR